MGDLSTSMATPGPFAVVEAPRGRSLADIALPGAATLPPTSESGAQPGSRRRRLWELPTSSHCPIIGVCVPMQVLRTLMRKVTGDTDGDDYTLHCGAVGHCTRRSPVAERLQRELDQRHAQALRDSAAAKSSEALLAWWDSQRFGADVGGALWATLTHPRCRASAEERVLRDIHMQQHQLGAAERIDARRLIALSEENGILARELGAIQARTTRQMREKDLLLEQRGAEVQQMRGALISKDRQLDALRAELARLEAAFPGLPSRAEQARRAQSQLTRIHALERDLLLTRHRLQALQARQHGEPPAAGSIDTAAGADETAEPTGGAPAALPALADKSVLCVGGRPDSVPFYRFLIERSGGRFLHHDGGQEEHGARLDASLSSADLVICHTGCLSHGAYFRVKDHCKRTGTRCVFVDNPSRASLQRALASLARNADPETDTRSGGAARRAFDGKLASHLFTGGER